MKKIFLVLAVFALVFATAVTTSPVKAVAYGTQFVTSITYQNVGTAAANITIQFYPKANGTPIPVTPAPLAKGAGTSLYVGSVSGLSSGFLGSAVLSSDQPVVATLVQIGSGTVKNRPLSGAFSVGSNYVLVPTVLKNYFGSNSVFSVQNVGSAATDVTLKFVPTSGATVTHTVSALPAGSAEYIDMGTFPGITAPTFNGSVQINTTGSVVASSMELGTTSDKAYAFEGATDFASTIFMPSALCSYNGQTSWYAVQNTAAGNVGVTVKYSNGKNDGPYTLAPGAKKSFGGCAAGNPAGFIGSAQIVSTGGDIVAMGKIDGGGLTTAFLGFTDGAQTVALPYVRWTQTRWLDGTRQRAYIAIQNVGTAPLAAGAAKVEYYDKAGTLVGTHPLAAMAVGGKANSNPSTIGAAGAEFGAYPDGSFGGAAVVKGPVGSKLAVVVRIVTYVGGPMVGEDYQGIPLLTP